MTGLYDIAVIGGGINGCGIARDAAGRGLAAYLCEQGDLASGTSSASTKLLHGGLRYLEYYQFRLVREALAEREVIWRMAPHIVWPLRFILPQGSVTRPRWMLRLGLFLYDHLGGRELLPPTRGLDLAADPAGGPLKAALRGRGFEYSDCWIDDARLVALNAADAAQRGAVIETRTKAVSAQRRQDRWVLRVADQRTGALREIEGRILINAAGPWVGQVLDGLHHPGAQELRLVQGSHIVVRRMFTHDRCYLLQNTDQRVIFAIPYEGDFTLIGTTDRDYAGDPAKVAASEEEIGYLCAAANRYFAAAITPNDVVWSYAGVRPLYADRGGEAQSVTRDYVLDLDAMAGAPLLSIFGGKITTYRRLAEQALEKLAPHLPAAARAVGRWTGIVPLPGGDFPATGFAALVEALTRRYPWLAAFDTHRLARSYGTRVPLILGDATAPAALGEDFGAGLSEAEIRYLMREEFAERAEDILWRRTKLGLRLAPAAAKAIEDFMARERRGQDTGRDVAAPALTGRPS